jgi:peptide/nickel transport system ATP-binding protein
MSLLEVKDLSVRFPTEDGVVNAVNHLSFSVEQGKTLGIVGESGSGKSVTSLAIMGLHRGGRAQLSGEILVGGTDVLNSSDETVRKMRGERMAMIFQDPLSALNPFQTIGKQIVDAYRVHHPRERAAAKTRAIEMLDRVGIPNPDRRFDEHPHQFSGGMRQRAMIAMSLVCNPQLLIADEPTTALDVTVQAQILDLMRDLQREFGSAIIIITHDLGVVAEISDDILVMYGGRCVEYGSVRDILLRPNHPYAWGLLTSMPRMDGDVNERLRAIPGSPPSLINLPSGCAFHPRCTYSDRVPGDRCTTEVPELRTAAQGGDHVMACHLDAVDRIRVAATEVVAAG